MMQGASGTAAEAARLVAAFAGAEGLEQFDQVALRLRYDPGHLRQMCHGAGPNGRSRHELFRRIWSAWPQGAEKPRELQQWERDHPRTRRDVICETSRIRRCIACGEIFLSEGVHHRLCRRHQAARVAEYYDIAVRHPDEDAPQPLKDPVEERFKALANAWIRAPKAARKRFVIGHRPVLLSMLGEPEGKPIE